MDRETERHRDTDNDTIKKSQVRAGTQKLVLKYRYAATLLLDVT